MSAGQAALPAHGAPRGHEHGHGRGHDHGHAAGLSEVEGHAASTRIVVGYGFWIFLISDIILFAAFFATYAVLTNSTDGGPTGRDLFDMRLVAIETACLLASSFSCGMAGIGVHVNNKRLFHGAMLVTFLLGAGFLAIELHEFAEMIEKGAGPSRSGFLSAFFALIGCHGLHVTAGMLWLLTMMAQVVAKGFREDIQRRMLCFALFWHTLDIIWVGLFSLVYLVGLAL